MTMEFSYIDVPLTEEEEYEIDCLANRSLSEEDTEEDFEPLTINDARSLHNIRLGDNDLGNDFDLASTSPAIESLDLIDRYHHLLRSAVITAQECRPGMRPDWMRIIRERPAEQWVDDISEITVEKFKRLLAGPGPPTFEEFEQLGYLDTNLMGVYVSPIKQRHGEGRSYLYIGSTSSERSLTHRIAQHKRKAYSEREAQKGAFHHRLLNQEHTPRDAKYVIACVAKSWAASGTDKYYYLRKTVVFAEAIYTHWLLGIWKRGLVDQYAILPICRWDSHILPWSGCCRFSPFTFPLPGSMTPLSAEERKVANRERAKLRYQNMTSEQKQKLRKRISDREGPLFRNLIIKRWKKTQQQRKRQASGAKPRPPGKCAYCRSTTHFITDCQVPGKEEFKLTVWKGRFYHRRRSNSKKTAGTNDTAAIGKHVRHCGACGVAGHNVRTCPEAEAKQLHHPARCSKCWKTGHNCLKCPSSEKP